MKYIVFDLEIYLFFLKNVLPFRPKSFKEKYGNEMDISQLFHMGSGRQMELAGCLCARHFNTCNYLF
jgi:hypothetical protein